MKYFPVFLALQSCSVLVVGGGLVAQRKVLQLLKAEARIHIVSPTLTPTLAKLAKENHIAYRKGQFEEDDLTGVRLVIGATDDPQIQIQIAKAAQAHNLFCNIVDTPKLCSFFCGAVIEQGDLVIAVSTGGQSPALAQRIKREIETFLGPEYSELAAILGKWRPKILETIRDAKDRAELFHTLAGSDMLDLLRRGKKNEAEKRIETSVLSRDK